MVDISSIPEGDDTLILPHRGRVATAAMGMYMNTFDAVWADEETDIATILKGDFHLKLDVSRGVDSSADLYLTFVNKQEELVDPLLVIENCHSRFINAFADFFAEEAETIQRYDGIIRNTKQTPLPASSVPPLIMATDLVVVPEKDAAKGFLHQLRHLRQDEKDYFVRNPNPSKEFLQVIQKIQEDNKKHETVFAPVRFFAFSTQAWNADADSFEKNAHLYTQQAHLYSAEPGCMHLLGTFDIDILPDLMDELNRSFLERHFEDDPRLKEVMVNSFDYRRYLGNIKKPYLDMPVKFNKTESTDAPAVRKAPSRVIEAPSEKKITAGGMFIVDCFKKQAGTYVEALLWSHPAYKQGRTGAGAFQFIEQDGRYDMKLAVGGTRDRIVFDNAITCIPNLSHDQARMLHDTLTAEIQRVEFYSDGMVDVVGTKEERNAQWRKDGVISANIFDLKDVLTDKPVETKTPFIVRTEQIFVPKEYMPFFKDDFQKQRGRSYQYCQTPTSKMIAALGYEGEQAEEFYDIFGEHIYPTQFVAVQCTVGQAPDGKIYNMSDIDKVIFANDVDKKKKSEILAIKSQLLIQNGYDLMMVEVDGIATLRTVTSLTLLKALEYRLERDIIAPYLERDEDLKNKFIGIDDHYSRITEAAGRAFDGYNTQLTTGLS